MLDQKSPVCQDNHSNPGDGPVSFPELNKPPRISGPKVVHWHKFAAIPSHGSGSVPASIATPTSRSGFGTQLSLTYDSGSGNGSVVFGWNLSLPLIDEKL